MVRLEFAAGKRLSFPVSRILLYMERHGTGMTRWDGGAAGVRGVVVAK